MEKSQPSIEFTPTTEHQAMLVEVSQTLEINKDFEIKSHEDCELAMNQGNSIATLQKRLKDTHKQIKAPYLHAGRAVDNFFNPEIKKLDGVKNYLGQKVSVYRREQDRLERERQAEARRLAEEEERKRQAEIEAEAMEAAEQGDEEAFEELAEEIEQPTVATVVPIVRNEMPKVKGATVRKSYVAEVTNLKTFLKAALNDNTLLAMVNIDVKAIATIAKASKGRIDYPGITVREVSKTSFRSRRN